MLIYGPKGWEIEKDTYTDELLAGFDKLIESGIDSFNMLYLKDRGRDMIILLLDKIQARRDSKYIPILKAWRKVEYKKVRARINSVIRAICDILTVINYRASLYKETGSCFTEPTCLFLKRKDSGRFLHRL
jgi:hypothetical protein